MADSVKQRTVIGACLIAAIVGLLAFDHWSGRGWGVVALVGALTAAGLHEYGLLAGAVAPIPARGLMLLGTAWVLVKGLGHALDPRLHHALGPLAIAGLYALFFACLRGAPSVPRFHGLAATVLGFVYLPLLGGFALDARFTLGPVGEAAFFYVVAIAKGTDICAYFAGKSMGRTKFIPSVSPGKTVAGFVGAVAGAVGITCAFSQWSALGLLVPLPAAPGLGILMSLVVVSGDLIESFLKRSVAVKDSAKLVPGFGGVLDIIDSVVIAAPPVYFVLSAAHARTGALG